MTLKNIFSLEHKSDLRIHQLSFHYKLMNKGDEFSIYF